MRDSRRDGTRSHAQPYRPLRCFSYCDLSTRRHQPMLVLGSTIGDEAVAMAAVIRSADAGYNIGVCAASKGIEAALGFEAPPNRRRTCSHSRVRSDQHST
jgi:hypothetical protein